MIDMHSKYDNMHKNGMFYALIFIKNYIITCINCMLSPLSHSQLSFAVLVAFYPPLFFVSLSPPFVFAISLFKALSFYTLLVPSLSISLSLGVFLSL